MYVQQATFDPITTLPNKKKKNLHELVGKRQYFKSTVKN